MTKISYDLSNYQRYFELYDRNDMHEPKLGPEPSKGAILAASDKCRNEGRLLWKPLLEAAGVPEFVGNNFKPEATK